MFLFYHAQVSYYLVVYGAGWAVAQSNVVTYIHPSQLWTLLIIGTIMTGTAGAAGVYAYKKYKPRRSAPKVSNIVEMYESKTRAAAEDTTTLSSNAEAQL